MPIRKKIVDRRLKVRRKSIRTNPTKTLPTQWVIFERCFDAKTNMKGWNLLDTSDGWHASLVEQIVENEHLFKKGARMLQVNLEVKKKAEIERAISMVLNPACVAWYQKKGFQ